jgi:hypothetical protein
MNNQEIIGMDSAHTAAKEMPYGSNMTISAALVIEMVERTVELERELSSLVRGIKDLGSISYDQFPDTKAAENILKEPKS